MRRLPSLLFALLILAPCAAFAQNAPGSLSFLPAWLATALSVVGIGSVSALSIVLLHRLAPPFFAWLANKEVPQVINKAELLLEQQQIVKDHPSDWEIVKHQEERIGACFSDSLIELGTDLGTLQTISKDSLTAVGKRAIAKFMSGVDEPQLLASLEALGQAEGGNVLTWVTGLVSRLMHHTVAPPGVASVAKAAGPIVPKPAPAAGFADPRLLLGLLVAMLVALVVFPSCTATQKASAGADLKLLEQQSAACTSAEFVAALPAASKAITIGVDGFSVDKPALEATGIADTAQLLWCVLDDAGKDFESVISTPTADTGPGTPAAAVALQKLHVVRLAQSATTHAAPAP